MRIRREPSIRGLLAFLTESRTRRDMVRGLNNINYILERMKDGHLEIKQREIKKSS